MKYEIIIKLSKKAGQTESTLKAVLKHSEKSRKIFSSCLVALACLLEYECFQERRAYN